MRLLPESMVKVKNGQYFIYVCSGSMLWQCLAVLEATEKRAVHKFQFDDDDEKRIEEVEKALARAGFARYALGITRLREIQEHISQCFLYGMRECVFWVCCF